MDESGKNYPAKPPASHETSSLLHSRIYLLIVALACWLVISVWLFSGVRSTDYLLAIVSGFIFVAEGLPFILSRLRRGEKQEGSFRSWSARDFETWTGRLRGSQAATEILLPIAAVAFGLTAIGIVLHLVEIST